MADKCAFCGAELAENELVCSACGAQLQQPPEEQTLPQHSTEPVDEILTEEPEKPVSTPCEASEEDVSEKEPEVILEEVLDSESTESTDKTETAAPVSEATASKKKLKWWYIAIPVALVIAIVAGLLLGPFFIYLAPKVVLAKALTATAEDLALRSEGTPVSVMNKAYDDSQKSTATMNMDLSVAMVGDLHIGMVAQMDSNQNQGHIAMDMELMGHEMDMNLYLDREVAAFNMDMITGKSYYGIYYDSFGEDIRKNGFLCEAIGEDNLVMMENAVDLLDKTMNLETITPEEQRECLKVYGEVLLSFIDERDSTVGKADAIIDGSHKNCKTVAFTVTESEFGELLDRLIDIAETDPLAINYYRSSTLDFSDEGWKTFLEEYREYAKELQKDGDGDCEILFYLSGGKVVQIDINYSGIEDGQVYECSCSLNFGSNADTSDISLTGTVTEGEEETDFSAVLSTKKDGDKVQEELVLSSDADDEEITLTYEWDCNSGDMQIFIEENGEIVIEMDCVFRELENGYQLSIPEFGDYVTELVGSPVRVDCSMDISVTAGAEIEVPKIKDITKLTELDLMRIFMNLRDL